MSETKLKKLQEFVDDFNKKMKSAFEFYEKKKKKEKNLNKSFSEVKIRKLPKLTIKRNEVTKNKIWKSPIGTPKYFGEFKRLSNNYELSDWEKVSNYIFYLIIKKNREE